MTENTFYVAKRADVANLLLSKGFNLVKIVKHKRHNYTSVFLFEDNPEIKDIVNEFYGNLRSS